MSFGGVCSFDSFDSFDQTCTLPATAAGKKGLGLGTTGTKHITKNVTRYTKLLIGTVTIYKEYAGFGLEVQGLKMQSF